MAAPATREVDKDELRTLLAGVLDVEVEQITDDAHFIEDIGVDSLMALEVVVVLEKTYGVRLGEDELKRVTTLDRAYRMLQEKLTA
ncbi:MAG TPA: acyl carrier protein [Micromonospora sp.]